MGTQFSSRLGKADAKRLLEGLKRAQSSVITTGPSPRSAQKFGEAVVAEVISVAQSHDFCNVFEHNTLFSDVLNWLKEMQSDAVFNGFEGIIHKYDLKKAITPPAELSKRLQHLTTRTETLARDPLRVALSNAAKAILARVMTIPVSKIPGEIPAKTLGRKFAKLDLRKMVTEFIKSFITEIVVRLIARADSHRNVKLIRQAEDVSVKEAERLARRAAKTVAKEGKLADTAGIHGIVHRLLCAPSEA